MKYRPEIDGLRAVAVVSVIAHHAGLDAFSGGYVGVDVFFVISGFLITALILAEHDNASFSLREFYLRRARRILPALTFTLLLTFPIAWMALLPNDMQDFLQSVVAISLFASNFLFWKESGYFDSSSELKPLLHTWSLAVEEQFYFLFPIALILLLKCFGKRSAVLMTSSLALTSLALAQQLNRDSPDAAFYLLPTRLWEILVGSILAFLIQYGVFRDERRGLREFGSFAGFGMIIAAITIYDSETPFPSMWTVLPVAGSGLVVYFANQQTATGKLLATPPLVRIGLLSYSAYLLHHPTFAFARYMSLDEPPSWLFLLLGGLVFGTSWVSWKYIEIPARAQKVPLLAWVLLFVSVLLISLIGLRLGGFSGRYAEVLEGDVGHHKFHEYVDAKFVDCEPKTISDAALRFEGSFLRCKQSRPGVPEIILLGDSHAEHLFIGIAEGVPEKTVAFYIQGDVLSDESEAFKPILSSLLTNHISQQVLVAMHYLDRLPQNGGQSKGFERAVETLVESGKSVVLLGDVPRFDQDPASCKFATPLADTSLCSMSRLEAERQRDTYEPYLKSLAERLGLRLFFIDSPLCDREKCSMFRDGKILYRDENHLNIPGSRLIGKYLLDQLANS